MASTDASGFIEHIAQIEIGQGVTRIDCNGRAVMLFRQRVILPVVMQRAQVDVRGGVVRIEFQDPLIGRDRLGLGIGVFFKRNALREKASNVGGNRSRPDQRSGAFRTRGTGDDFVSSGKVEHELAGNGLDQFTFVTESNAVPSAEGAGLEQRIFHSRSLLLHGLERLADHRGAHFGGAQVSNFFDLQQVKKGIALGGGNQSGFFPTCQLTRREPKNPEQVCSTIAVHGYRELSISIIRSWAGLGKWK
jgi:hypothetical protein